MIPFNKPYYSGNEASFISGLVANIGQFDKVDIYQKCESLLEKKYNFQKIFLTNSCTIALEMAAVLIDIKDDDEVILPSYTYVSTANAFALRGAKVIFADSKTHNPNMDEEGVEKLITSKTKAIVIVHYAGIACDMDKLKAIAVKHNLFIIEDAAHSVDSFYKNKAIGTFGDIACFSFHETKNIHCGEGGFISINNSELISRAEIIRNKGTNRSAFSRGEVKKYEWIDIGFSSLPSKITAAFLFSQLEKIDIIQKHRTILWNHYNKRLDSLKHSGIQLPTIPEYSAHNSHIFYLICKDNNERDSLIEYLRQNEIQAVFHYQALHESPYYLANEKKQTLPNAERYSSCLVRLPLFYELTLEEVDYICDTIIKFYQKQQIKTI